MPSTAELEEKIELALAALGLTANADTYLMTSALSSVYFAAMRQRAAEDFQPAYAAAVDDAVQQRNAQWMADESLFQAYVRPLLTFLEGFTYAMTPILVFLVGLGPYGMQVIIGFLVTLIWIVSWMPTLAVVNFFQHLIAAGKLEALAENGAGIDTMAGLFQADSIVQTYLATGGNMAAAVPALTASFLFLGARAFGANLMAQRLSSGQDTFKEEKASPDSLHAGAMVSYQGPFTFTPTAGMTTMTAAERVTPSYSWSSSQSLAVSSAESRSQGLSRSFVETAGRRVAASFGNSESGAVAGVFNSHEAASKSHSLAAAQGWSTSLNERACRLGGGQRRAAHGHRLWRLARAAGQEDRRGARCQAKYIRAAMSRQPQRHAGRRHQQCRDRAHRHADDRPASATTRPTRRSSARPWPTTSTSGTTRRSSPASRCRTIGACSGRHRRCSVPRRSTAGWRRPTRGSASRSASVSPISSACSGATSRPLILSS